MKVTVLSNQTLADIAIQVYGNAQGVFALAQENGMNVTEELVPGQTLSYSAEKVMEKGIVRHYGANGICPATVSVGDGTGIFDRSFDSTFG